MSDSKKLSMPISSGTLLSLLMIVNGVWLISNLLQFPVPLGTNAEVQSAAVWFAALTSIIGAVHMIMVKFRHTAVKSLL